MAILAILANDGELRLSKNGRLSRICVTLLKKKQHHRSTYISPYFHQHILSIFSTISYQLSIRYQYSVKWTGGNSVCWNIHNQK
jgi:hypothetical protein